MIRRGRAGLLRWTWTAALTVLCEALLIAAALYVFLQGWRRDIHVPLGFSGDTLFYLTQSKSTIDNGWWWFNPMIGAPFGLDELAFPSNSNVDQAIVWAVSRMVQHSLAAINLAWALMVVLSGVVASWCLRRLEVSRPLSIAAGALFAVSPYALFRNVAHFGMVVYLVPFACTAALQLASGRLPERGYLRGSGAVLLAGCALLGFNYVYYPFFACFFVGIGLLIGFFTHWRRRIVRDGVTCLVVLMVCTLLNLAPSLYSWSQHGKPIVLEDKTPAQSELFGLKVRTLVSPVFPHVFPPFRRWSEQEAAAQFPLETENATARLGLVGTVGFVGLIALLVVPSAADRFSGRSIVLGASHLTIAAVLLATIGGVGSLFSLLISPEIRAYNRICPFLEFFALAAVALAIDTFFKTRRQRTAAASVVLLLGLTDQGGAAAGMNAAYASSADQLASLEPFVRQLESRLPDRAMVLQLPFKTYLNNSLVARLEPYEHFKPYLVSSRIRWSYPALSNEQVRWQNAAAQLDPARLPYRLAREGFSAVVVDRNGYVDEGAAVMAAIRAPLRDRGVIAETNRYAAFDIRSLAGATEDALTGLPAEPVPAAGVMNACTGQPALSIDQIDGVSPLSAGNPLHVFGSRGFKASGWAIDPSRQTAAASVEVRIDQRSYPATYGIDRGDVAAYFRRPEYSQSGFAVQIQPDALVKGAHTLSIRVISANRDCYYESPGTAIVVQ